MGWRGSRPLRRLAGPLAVILAMPVLVPAAVLLAAHTDTGRDLIASAVYELSGGQVALDGLTGLLPHRPRVARLELRDAAGTWLRAEDAVLDLDLRYLFRREIGIRSLTARSLALLRLPAASGDPAGPIRSPWPVRVDQVQIARVSLDALAPSLPAVGVRVAASGHGAGDAWHIAAARIDAEGGRLEIQGSVSTDALALGWSLELDDLGAILLGAAGRIHARGDLTGTPHAPELVATLNAPAGLALPGAIRIAGVAAEARLADLLGVVEIVGSARLAGLVVGGVSGDLTLDARGPLGALALSAETRLRAGTDAVSGALQARLDGPGRRLAVERLEASARGEALRLLAPAVIDLSDGVAVDRLRLGLRQGVIDIAGRAAPALALDATLAGLPVELVRLVAPDLPLTGTLGAEVRLVGPVEAPTGSVRARADGLRLTEGNGRSLPAANVQLTAQVGPAGTEVEARGEAGQGARLGLVGRIGGGPTFGTGVLDLRADGRLDLALLDPLLTGSGHGLRGQTILDTRIRGTLGAPRLDGSLQLTEGAFWDRSLGLALTDIRGRLGLAGETLRVEPIEARAGPGTLTVEGSIGLLSPGLPVDLRLSARDARPLQRDELSLQGDADLRLTGAARERLGLAGTVQLDRMEVRLPERLPAVIHTLEVREKGQRRAPPPGTRGASPWRPDLALDLTVAAPRQVEVRGRGVDAELGGEVRVRGTLAEPAVTGGLDLIRGQITLVGQSLRFSRGRIGFDGAAGLSPVLDLEARATAAGGTAILAVRGTASAPRIELRGEPELPQDEVLSRLLFGVAGGRLSAWQAARLGLAAASLAGTRDPEAGPLARLRSGLGLSRLGLVADEHGDATLEGGRDLGDRAYLGARQSSRTGEPQGVLRFEASPRIQLEADVGPVGGTRAGVAFEHEF